MDIESIGNKLKQHRINKDMSIRDLSAASNIAASTISQIETGKNSPNLITLKAICDALEVPVFSLFLEEDKPKIRLVKRAVHEPFIRNISNGRQIKESLIIQGKTRCTPPLWKLPLMPIRAATATTAEKNLYSYWRVVSHSTWRATANMSLKKTIPFIIRIPSVIGGKITPTKS